MTNVVDLFEKDKNILEKLIERLKKENWQLKNSTNKSLVLEKKDSKLNICWEDEQKTVVCEYEKGRRKVKLFKKYKDNLKNCDVINLTVELNDIKVIFRQKEDSHRTVKEVEVERELDDISLLLPEEFCCAYTNKTFWLWSDELFEYMRFPEPFVKFFESAYNEAKSLVNDLKLNKMPEEAFIINALIWRILKELKEGYNKSLCYIIGSGIVDVNINDEIRIAYKTVEKGDFIEMASWTIDQNGSIRKKGIGNEEIDKALEWCKPAINYFIHLSKNKRR